MSEQLITSRNRFLEFCERIRRAGIVAFDTEFVSEFTYRPDLCLLQFAIEGEAVAVDPLEVDDLSAWWELMLDPEVRVVVHGGREEIRFCIGATGSPPLNLVDLQIAEGLRSTTFPISYASLVPRVIGKRTTGKETRTDWRKRPLTHGQIHYAIEDVEHVLPIWYTQLKDLLKRKRADWVIAESIRLIEEIDAERTRENWRRLPGIQKLNARELAIAREVYQWREQESQQKNRPVRKTLRDDLVIELAERQPRTEVDLLATRDMNRSDYRRVAPDLLRAIETGLAIPKDQLPFPEKPDKKEEEQIIGQLLGFALANLCYAEEVAMPLVGTVSDLRHLVRWHVYEGKKGTPPRLMQGWRGELCGKLLSDVLNGKIAIRVADPQSAHPLVFERMPSAE